MPEIRKRSITEHNIRSGFLKAGIWPYNLDKVLDQLPTLDELAQERQERSESSGTHVRNLGDQQVQTPKKARQATYLALQIQGLDPEDQTKVMKLAKASRDALNKLILLRNELEACREE